MRKARKALLIIEVAICFLPATLILLMGVLVAPLQLLLLFQGVWQALFTLVPVACGLAGLVALVSVIRRIFGRTEATLKPKIALALIVLGLLPVLPYLFFGDTIWWQIAVGYLPLLCSIHLVYLARGYLFSGRIGQQGD